MNVTKGNITTGKTLTRHINEAPRELIGSIGYLYGTDKSREGKLVTITGFYLEGGRTVVNYSGIVGDSVVYAEHAKFARYTDQEDAKRALKERTAEYFAANARFDYDEARRLTRKD